MTEPKQAILPESITPSGESEVYRLKWIAVIHGKLCPLYEDSLLVQQRLKISIN